jgi:hypothetical protein
MKARSLKARAKASGQRVKRIDQWLRKAGIRDAAVRSQVAIDLSDSLDAAERIGFHLSALLRTDPRTKRGADKALTHAAHIGVWAFNELRDHVVSLQRTWERRIEYPIARLGGKRRSRRRAA